jgi:hypothetical protein
MSRRKREGICRDMLLRERKMDQLSDLDYLRRGRGRPTLYRILHVGGLTLGGGVTHRSEMGKPSHLPPSRKTAALGGHIYIHVKTKDKIRRRNSNRIRQAKKERGKKNPGPKVKAASVLIPSELFG